MNWYIGPWQWLTAPMPYWAPPVGFSGLDLRTIPQMSQLGGTPGQGLFWGQGIITDSSYTHIGSGSWHDIKPTGRAKSAIPVRTGYTLKGDDLIGMVLDLLTDGADPDGSEAPKPLTPTIAGRLELHCGQQHFERFRWGGRHTGILRAMIRADFSRLMDDAAAGRLKDREHHRRVLDDLCIRYGVDDWKEFVPAARQQEISGRLPRATTITDDFTRSDGDTIGNSLSWTEVNGDFDTVSNQAKLTTVSAVSDARADSDLSSADHYAQASIVVPGTLGAIEQGGVAARFSSSAETFYLTFVYRANDNQYLYKMVAGSLSLLTNAAITFSTPDTYKVECNGSTIKAYQAGAERLSATDSAISGGTRGGIYGFGALGLTWDNFEAADLGGGGGGILYTQLERGTRGMFRGMYTGGA